LTSAAPFRLIDLFLAITV